jgi:predicted nuclease of predicted toxin-antitoxin system
MKLPNLVVVDECVEYEIVTLLRENNIPVLSIMESHRSIEDIDVLQIAVSSSAYLLTEDKDFGELVFRLKLPHHGILLARFPNDYEPDIKAQKIAKIILEIYEELENRFSVLDEYRLRIRK